MKSLSLLFLAAFLFMHPAKIKSATLNEKAAATGALFEKFNRTNGPGASVMVIQNGRKVFAKSYGLADVEQKVCATPGSNYRLASVSKQFTAMAIMILADRKKLSFDDPITKFFPEFPEYGKRITVRQLLNHTSGLVDYEDIIPKETTIPVLDINVLRLLQREEKTYFPPGSQFRYSNTAFAFLALIVEKVSGEKFASFLQENIFKPLGMKNTLAYEQGISSVPNRAYGYSPDGSGFKRTDQSVTSSVLGDGGIYSSVNDLFKWDQALYDMKLVSKKTFATAWTPGKSTLHGEGIQYGFGWFLGEYRGLRNIYHTGDSIGFRTIISRFPERQFTVIILSNEHDAELPGIAHKIADLYLFN
jgi:CubicO group peptidase (beta-lactamase class C family)